MPFLLPAIAAIGTAIAGVGAAAGVLAVNTVFALGGSAAAASVIGEAVGAIVPSVIELGALAGVSALTTPKPKLNSSGSPQAFKADPRAFIPMVMGRYGVGGNLVYETVSGGANKAEHGAQGNQFLVHFTILSGLGPVQAIESLRFNDTILSFSGQAVSGGYIPQEEVQAYNPGYTKNANGSYANNVFASKAWQTTQLGDVPSAYLAPPNELAANAGALTEWTAAHGFSSFCASCLVIDYDMTVYSGGVPQRQWVIQGYKTYDPRQDATVAGGAGAQRWTGAGATQAAFAAAWATRTWSDNPIIHALNYGLGHFLPDAATGKGRLYAGVGAGVSGVDVASFMHAASVADANAWKVCGQWSTGDGKFSVLTAMLQAGGATFVPDRGRISCSISEPLTSLGTVTANDLAGPVTLDTTVSRRDRPNTIFYSYSSEAHRWQVVQADTPISPATYVAEDGGVRVGDPLELTYVPNVDQGAQLTAYAIANAREIPNIVLTGKPHLRAYAVGDCFTIDIPEVGLATTKLVVTSRKTSFSTGMVTLTCRTETDAKHAYCMGLTGVAPPTPGISGIDPSIVPAPIPASWSAVPVTVTDSASGAITHVIRINGSTIDNVFAADVIVEFAQITSVGGVDQLGPVSQQAFSASVEAIDLTLAPGRWHLWIRYRTAVGAENPENTLDLGEVDVAGGTSANTINVGDRTAAQLTGQVDDLFTTYGSTASAAVSAATAASAAAAAQAAQMATGVSASGAAGSATAAQGSANTATAAASDADSQAAAAHADRLEADSASASASGSAVVANSAAAAASASQAAAQTSASLSASVGPGVLNTNPDFVAWADPNGLPDGYGFWENSDNTSRVGGLNGRPYAVQQSPTPSEQLGFAQYGNLRKLRGWYVLEADVRIRGSFVGAGAGFYGSTEALPLYFASDPDINGIVRATSENDYWSYKWRKLVQATVEDYGTTLYGFTAYSGLGDVSGARSIVWDHLAVRPATEGEVAGHLALPVANSVSAGLSTEQSVRASADAALSSTQTSQSSTLGGLSATVTAQGETLAAVQGVQAAKYDLVVQAGSEAGELDILAIQQTAANGTVTAYSLFRAVSQIISLANDEGGAKIDVLTAVGGRAHFAHPVYIDVGSTRLIIGPGFGAAGTLVLWVGSTGYDETSATAANAAFYIDETSTVGGSGLPSGTSGLVVVGSSNSASCSAAFSKALPAGSIAINEAAPDLVDDGSKGSVAISGTWTITVNQGSNSTPLATGSFTGHQRINYTVYDLTMSAVPSKPIAIPYTGSGISVRLFFTPNGTVGAFGCDLTATFYANG